MEEKRSAAEEELNPLASQPTLFLKVNLFNSGKKKKKEDMPLFLFLGKIKSRETTK